MQDMLDLSRLNNLHSESEWHQFLEELWQQGLEIWLDEKDKLHISGPDELEPIAKQLIKDHSPRLKRTLETQPLRYRGYPLSHRQLPIYFLQLQQPQAVFFNQLVSIRLDQALTSQALENNWNNLCENYAEMRVQMYHRQANSACQFIHNQAPKLEHIEQAFFSPEQRNTWVENYADTPFVFDREFLIRACILTDTQSGERFFIFVAHHIIADLQSLYMLMRACIAGKQQQYTPYKNYIFAQRQKQKAAQSSDWQHYHQQCTDSSDAFIHKFPHNYYWQKHAQNYHNSEWQFNLGSRLKDKIITTANAQKCRPLSIMLSALQVLVKCYSQINNFSIYTPLTGREVFSEHKIFGQFAFASPVACQLNEQHRFADLVQQNESQLKTLFNLEVNTDSINSPNADIIFCWHNITDKKLGFSGENLDRFEQRGAIHPIVINAYNFDSQLILSWRYDKTLFTVQEIKRFNKHLKNILSSALKNSESPIYTIEHIDKNEKQSLLRWSENHIPKAHNKSLLNTFLNHVEIHPQKVAVSDNQQQLTYQGLHEASNQLANALIANGLPDNKRIAVRTKKSCELIIAYLAVLKCGCIYVPVANTLQKRQIETQLDSIETSLLLSNKLWEFAEIDCLHLHEKLWKDCEALFDVKEQEDTACIIFSTGSTGEPKAIPLSQAGIFDICHTPLYININAHQTIALASSPGFDASCWEIWSALLNGAQLKVIDKDTLLNPKNLRSFLAQQPIQVLFLTTALLHFHAQFDSNMFKSLAYLVTGGEALNPQIAETLLNTLGKHRLINAYGPAENGIMTTVWPVEANTFAATPIGKPIDNRSIYVLDEKMSHSGIGIEGDIYVAGSGLSNAYIGEQQHNPFIDNPYSAQHNQTPMLFASGDKGRWRENGQLEFTGRQQQTQKILGQWVDLQAMSLLLSEHPDIEQAHLQIEIGDNEQKQLCAYLVCAEEKRSDSLLRNLRHRLLHASHMIMPSLFSFIESLPLNHHHKIDSNALAKAEKQTFIQSVKQLNSTEAKIHAIWQKLLGRNQTGLSQIDIDENFFYIGGHSILAIQLLQEIEKQFDVNLELNQIFAHPSISEQAQLLHTNKTQSTQQQTEYEEGTL